MFVAGMVCLQNDH